MRGRQRDLIIDRKGESKVTVEAEMWSDGATSQGMTAATKRWKMQGMGSSLEPPEGA